MGTVILDPDRHRAVVFDLDGVVTDTAAVHFGAWKQLFDEYLQQRGERAGEDHREFSEQDYRSQVDGKPRYDGVASFLKSRGIDLPWGDRDDPEDRDTVCGLGNRKDRYFKQRLEADGVTVFESTIELVRRLQDAGIGTGVFSASRNCRRVLEVAGLADLFPVRVDGVTADEMGLPGKPDPAMLVETVHRLGVEPGRAAVIEDARAGVRAGAAGGFALVIGVDRTGDPEPLRTEGADVVVSDLAEVEFDAGIRKNGGSTGNDASPPPQRMLFEIPDALDTWGRLRGVLAGRHPVFFLDFDGTLAPIVDNPSDVRIPTSTRSVLEALAEAAPIAIVSGRDLLDVRDKTSLAGAWFAGSHGFEIIGPDGSHYRHPAAEDALPILDEAERTCRHRLAEISGVTVDRKRYAIAVHYRQIRDDSRIDDVIGLVEDIGRSAHLRVTGGRKIVELRPDIDWHKGKAVEWVLDAMSARGPAVLPVYAGDDLTDEDALAAVHATGLGIVVRSQGDEDRATHAHVAVDDVEALTELLARTVDELHR